MKRSCSGVAAATGDEGRAKYHAALARNGGTGYCQGLTFWSPNVNIFRDPVGGVGRNLWRGPLPDRALGGGLRARSPGGPSYLALRAVACAKHYAVHSGPELR